MRPDGSRRRPMIRKPSPEAIRHFASNFGWSSIALDNVNGDSLALAGVGDILETAELKTDDK